MSVGKIFRTPYLRAGFHQLNYRTWRYEWISSHQDSLWKITGDNRLPELFSTHYIECFHPNTYTATIATYYHFYIRGRRSLTESHARPYRCAKPQLRQFFVPCVHCAKKNFSLQTGSLKITTRWKERQQLAIMPWLISPRRTRERSSHFQNGTLSWRRGAP